MVFLGVLSFCIQLQGQNYLAEEFWKSEFESLGTFSSPRLADLNRDGTMDIVLGAGRKEFTACDTAVIALDGRTGAVLWHVAARDQIFGSAAMMDVNDDQVPDIFIGGRSAELIAINGENGMIIWRFLPNENVATVRELGWYNFYNPQFVPDQNNDGIAELLVSNGGDVLAAPYDTARATGHLVVIDPTNGEVLAKAPAPDQHEIYTSVVTADINGTGDPDIIFGTGGETTPGNLYRTTLSAVIEQDLSNAMVLATGGEKGFIAPAVLADLNGDDILDIVANSVDGRMLAFNGKNGIPIWGGLIPGTEVYSSLAVAEMTGDTTPDFFGNFAIGTWPDLNAVRPLLVDGKSGTLIFSDSIGFYQMSSAVLGDFNDDGYNDAMLSVNFFMPNELGHKTIHNTLLIYDFQKGGKYAIVAPQIGSSVSSTPWVGDMDQDGKMDIIYCQMTTPNKVYTYDGFRVIRLSTDINLSTSIPWGAYMGSNYDGIYEHSRK